MLLFCNKPLFRSKSRKNSRIKSLSFGEWQSAGKEVALRSGTQKQQLPLAQLRSFSFILSPSHPLINIKPSSQLSSSPFSFLNLFYFLTSFLCNNSYQKSESFFFFIVTMERTIFSSRKGGGAEGEGRTTYENWELASVSFQQYPIKSFHYHTQNNRNTVGGQFSPRMWMNQ